jgi:hypothetical protein
VGATVELDVAGAAAGRTVFGDDHKFGNPPAPYNTTAHFVKADAIDTALFLIEKKVSDILWVFLIYLFIYLLGSESFGGHSGFSQKHWRWLCGIFFVGRAVLPSYHGSVSGGRRL